MADFTANFVAKDNITSTIKNIKNELDSVGSSASKMDSIQQRFDAITNDTKPLKRQLLELKKLMTEMNFEGMSNTAEFTNIAQYAGKISDAMGDASTAVKAFANDTSNLQAVQSLAQGVAGGFSALTGALSLFGVENDKVQQAILKVQAAMAVLNGVQAVANVLNKDSALVLKMKSLLMTTDTAAVTANTTAEAANTVAEGANATATTAATAATTANAAATKAATVAQLANNAAVMANPYVLAAMAIAALVAGLAVWVSNMDNASEAQQQLNAAMDAFSEEAERQAQTLGTQISTFMRLKKTYDESGGKVDVLTQKIINNKDAQRKLGVVLKTVDDVHKLFGKNSENYIQAAYARADALAAEAAEAATLGKVMAELSKVWAKLAKGEEVDFHEVTDALEKAGFGKNESFFAVTHAGGKYGEDFIVPNLEVDPNKVDEFITQINKAMIDKFYSTGAGKTLSKLYEKSMAAYDVDVIDFNKLLADNDAAAANADRTTKRTAATAQNAAKNTQEEIKKVLTTLEGCDAIIAESEKGINKLDRTSATYAADLAKLNQTILGARIAKLDLIDNSTLTGLAESKKLIQSIINDLPKGSEVLREWQKKLVDITLQANEMAVEMAKSNNLDDWKTAQSAVDKIITSLPEGSTELGKWVALWKQLNTKITDANRKIENLKKGIEQGSIAELQQQVKVLQDKLNNENLSVDARIKISDDIAKIQRQIDDFTKGNITIKPIVTPTFISSKKDDQRQSYTNAQAKINQIQEDFKHGIITSRKEANNAIADINDQLRKLELTPIVIHLESNVDKWVKSIKESFSGLDGIISATDGIISLTNALDEGKNGWEVFKASVQAVEGVLNAYSTVMQTIQTIQEIFNLTKTVSAALSTSDAVATQEATVASTEKAVVDTASVEAATAATVALKAQEKAYLDMAAAAIFAAHASIPFAGTGIASGLIAAMLSAMGGVHASTMALAAFAEGGIIGGNSRNREVPILAHTGEMVLNERQQANLFNAIDNGMFGGGQGQTVTFKLKGSDIYGSLKNYTNVKSKSSKITKI